MKRTKWLKSLAVVSALTIPMTTMLPAITSCSKNNYAVITGTIKETMVDEFLQLCKVPRMTWMGHEAYNFILDRMETFGFPVPTGRDEVLWSESTEAKAQIESAKTGEFSWIQDSRKHKYWGEYGNVWFDLPATNGYENVPTVMIQAHYDMNITFNSQREGEAKSLWLQNGVTTDYDKTKETIVVNDGLTSLGADNGVGVALLLSLAKHHKEFSHGAIRLMFTADESGATEHYFSGLHYLLETEKSTAVQETAKPLNGVKYIISLDGNVEGHVFTSVAGLHECEVQKDEITAEKVREATIEGYTPHQYTIKISGLTGGHSAYDINRGYASALQMLTQLLPCSDPIFQIVSLKCNNTSAYQICSGATATIISQYPIDIFNNNIQIVTDITKANFPGEGDFSITIQEDTKPTVGTDVALGVKQSQAVALLTSILNYGPLDWFDKPTNKIVKTSLNYGPLSIKKSSGEGTSTYDFNFHVVERSADEKQLDYFQYKIHDYIDKCLGTVFNLETKDIIHTADPAWEEQEGNPISNLMSEGLRSFRLGGDKDSSHAWLELSSFPQMYESVSKPKPYMVCVGPTILHSHETTEKVYTDTFDTVIKGILYTLDNSRQFN